MKLPNKISIHIYIYNIYEITVEAFHVNTIIIDTYIIYMRSITEAFI